MSGVRTCLRQTAAGSRSPARSPPTPSLLLLDEPSSGKEAEETAQLVAAVRRIRADRPELSMIVIEQDIALVMELQQRPRGAAQRSRLVQIRSYRRITSSAQGGTNSGSDAPSGITISGASSSSGSMNFSEPRTPFA